MGVVRSKQLRDANTRHPNDDTEENDRASGVFFSVAPLSCAARNPKQGIIALRHNDKDILRRRQGKSGVVVVVVVELCC